ncbi:MAG TPA: type IV toxin-antitoxin system AbiEi family antitoxin [Chitinophagaceae bacterium]|nr:type IV toxin-antitoxin system AbiEi family antitoxin [Chitinophagaceae bacterium]HMU60108.1 type IV toxin-antitoxin system AbiEi family antitoxin [Chitinophagaceae bacterium]
MAEVKEKFKISDKAINQSLYRLKTKKQIAQIRKGFYAIISPEYSNQGMVPAALFIDDLMQSLNKKYYVGLLSAAALHGAAHQQPMEFFVITEKPALRKINNRKLKLSFYVKKNWDAEDIIKKKTDAGNINVSTPELTALDLLYYTDSIGISNIVTILKELSTEIKAGELINTAKRYPQTAAIQRLGYLLDIELGNEKLSAALLKALKERKTFPVSLASQKSKDGKIDDKWKVMRNINIESDI